MSLRAQFHRLLQEATTTADFLQQDAQFLRQRAAAHREDIDTVQRLGASLVGNADSAIRGITPTAQATLQQEIARARYRLGNLHEHADQLWNAGTLIHGIVQDTGGSLLGALDMIPDPIWDFFGGLNIRVPTLSEVLVQGEAVMPSLRAHWDWNADAAMGFLSGLGGILHLPGFSAGPLDPDVQQAHASVGVALAPVDHHAAAAASQLQSAHTQAQVHGKQSGSCGGSAPTGQGNSYKPPAEPAHTLHSKQDIKNRVKNISLVLHVSGGGADIIIANLEGLDGDDIQELEYQYYQQNHTSIFNDINKKAELSVYDRYQINQLLAPQNTVEQTDFNNSASGSSHVMLPTNMLTPILPQGTYPNYQVWDASRQQTIPISDLDVFYVPDADAQKNGAPDLIATTPELQGHQSSVTDGLKWPGTYTAYIQIPSTDPNQPPQYVMYKQTVVDPKALGGATLVTLESNGAWPSAKDYLSNLQQKDPKAYNNVAKYITNDCIPVSAMLTSTKYDAQTIPLTLFAKKVGNQWEIIDVSDPSDPKHIQVYTGNSLQAAWDGDTGFVKENPYPDNYVLTAHSQNTDGTTISYNQDNTIHSLRRNIESWAEIISVITGFVGLIFPPAFAVSGLAGAVAGVIDIMISKDHSPNWDWTDPENIAKYASIGIQLGFGFLGVLDSAKALVELQGIEATSADATNASAKVTLWMRAAQNVTINGKFYSKGTMIAITVLMSSPYIWQILQSVKNRLSQADWNKINNEYETGNWSAFFADLLSLGKMSLSDLLNTLGQAKDQAGVQLAVIGLGFLPLGKVSNLARIFGVDESKLPDFFTQLSSDDDKLTKVAQRLGINKELLRDIADNEDLQAALEGSSPQFMDQMYQNYLTSKSTESFHDYLLAPNKEVLPALANSSDPVAATLSRYQSEQLKLILANPAAIKNTAGLSTANFANFINFLQTKPEMQALLARDLDIGKLQKDFKQWIDNSKDFSDPADKVVLDANGNVTNPDAFFRYESEYKHKPYVTGLADSKALLSDVITEAMADDATPQIVKDKLNAVGGDFTKLSPRDREIVLLGITNPDILQLYLSEGVNTPIGRAIEQGLQDAEKDIGKINNNNLTMSYVNNDLFYSDFNEGVGRSLAEGNFNYVDGQIVENNNIDALNTIMSDYSSSGKGSIGEWYYYYESIIPKMRADLEAQLRAKIADPDSIPGQTQLQEQINEQFTDQYILDHAEATEKELGITRKPDPFPVGSNTVQPDMFNTQTLTATDLKATNGKNVTKQINNGVPQLKKYIDAMNATPPFMKRLRYLFTPNGDGALSTFTEAMNNYGYLLNDQLSGNLVKRSKIEVDYLGSDGLVHQIDGQSYAAWQEAAAKGDQAAFFQTFEKEHPGISIQDFNAG